jgi:hypothetical protein
MTIVFLWLVVGSTKYAPSGSVFGLLFRTTWLLVLFMMWTIIMTLAYHFLK